MRSLGLSLLHIIKFERPLKQLHNGNLNNGPILPLTIQVQVTHNNFFVSCHGSNIIFIFY